MNTHTNRHSTQAGSSAVAPASPTGAQSDGGATQANFGQDHTPHPDGGHNDNPPQVPVAVPRSTTDSAISLDSDVAQQDQDQQEEDEGIFLGQDTQQEPMNENIDQWQQWIQNNHLNNTASNASTESLYPEDETEDDQVNSSSSSSTSTATPGSADSLHTLQHSPPHSAY